jgi:hypothetical protein
MSTYKVGSYTIYLRSNKITIISDSRRFFQKEILPKDLYGCDTKEDVYNIFKILLESDDINIRDSDTMDTIIITFYIKLNNKKKITIISLPEIDNARLPFDYALMKVETEVYEIKLFCILTMVLTLLNLFTYILL